MSIKGFNNQKAHGQANHVTVQSSGSDKQGIPTAQIYLYDLTATLTVASAVLSGDEKEITITLSAAHSARIGDIIRLLSGSIIGWEYEVKEIVSATAVKVWNTSSGAPASGINAKACRWITAKSDSEGALTTSAGPLQFTRNGATETVTEDTVTPSNNRPLPVKISGITGDINITANDLNVSISHLNDSVKIGDGVDLLAVNADGSINVGASALPTGAATAAKQDLLLAELQLKADLTETQPVSVASLPLPSGAATAAKQDLLLAELQLKADLSETQPVSLASVPLPTGAATSAKQDEEAILIGAVTETAPVSDTASSGLNGRLQRLAQRITSLIALLPASLGQKTMANSLAVAIASDQGLLSVNDSTSIAGTITTAQITVGTTAIRATAAGTAPNANRKRLSIKPGKNNTGNIYLGSSTVTTANGMEIIGPDRLDFEYDSADYYLISDTAGQTVEILEKV